MLGPWLDMALEPPPGYVAFVERHIDELRHDAARTADDEADARRLSTDVLTDIATSWWWLELVRTRLRRPDAAERRLRRALYRCAASPDSELRWDSDIAVVAEHPSGPQRAARPEWSSMAVRLARQASTPIEVEPAIEAAVAWQHACEVVQRRRRVLGLVLTFICVVVLIRLRRDILAAP